MNKDWKILTNEIIAIPGLDTNGNTYYFDSIISGGGYESSPMNREVFNFKKPIDRKEKPEWEYKLNAIKQFVKDLNFFEFQEGAWVVPAPTSKPRGCSEWDSRIDDTIAKLCKVNRNNLICYRMLDVDQSMSSAHSEGGTRNSDEIKSHLIISTRSPKTPPSKIYLIDDVITTGGHYKAYRATIRERYPNIPIEGLFWAVALHI
jgi:hypothetical protein